MKERTRQKKTQFNSVCSVEKLVPPPFETISEERLSGHHHGQNAAKGEKATRPDAAKAVLSRAFVLRGVER